MTNFYGMRSCSVKCNSRCCYFPRPGEPLSRREEKEINNIVNAAKNNLESFLPEYREIVKKIINEVFIVEKFDTKYLRCDTTKPGFDSAMVSYYPCIFLSNSENFLNKNKVCMIYPYRFSICRNTTPESCDYKR